MTQSAHGSAAGAAFRFEQNSLLANVCLAMVTTAGLFYVDILSALVIGLQDGLGYTPRQAGMIASANIFGAAAGGLLVVFSIERIRWRSAAFALLVVLLTIDLISTLIVAPAILTGVRFVHGVVGGALVGIGYSVIARTRTPERTFGMLLVIQFGLGAAGTAALPLLVLKFGAPALFLVLAAFTLLALAALPLVPDYPPRATRTESLLPTAVVAGARRLGLLAALVSVFMFQSSSMGLVAYQFNIGRVLHLSPQFLSAAVGIAMLVAACGSLLVVIIGLRWGRVWPLVVSIFVAIALRALLLSPSGASAFLAVVVGFATTHAFALPFLLGLCSAFDRRGQLTTLAGFVSKLGLAAGPAIGGFLLSGDNYLPLVAASSVGLCVALAACLWSSLTLARLSRDPPPTVAASPRLDEPEIARSLGRKA